MKKSRFFLFQLYFLFILIIFSKSEEKNKIFIISFQEKFNFGQFINTQTIFSIFWDNNFPSNIQIYIELTVGSKKQKIPFYLYLEQNPLVLQSANANKGEIKGIYDEAKSDTYKSIEEETNFEYEDLVKGMLSTDNFYFNSKPYNIPFYLSIENFPFSHITVGGKIGFNLWDRFQTPKKFQNLTFIKSLKNL